MSISIAIMCVCWRISFSFQIFMLTRELVSIGGEWRKRKKKFHIFIFWLSDIFFSGPIHVPRAHANTLDSSEPKMALCEALANSSSILQLQHPCKDKLLFGCRKLSFLLLSSRSVRWNTKRESSTCMCWRASSSELLENHHGQTWYFIWIVFYDEILMALAAVLSYIVNWWRCVVCGGRMSSQFHYITSQTRRWCTIIHIFFKGHKSDIITIISFSLARRLEIFQELKEVKRFLLL